MRTLCVIPARMASSRFPSKPLEPLLGMPMVIHVANRCKLSPAVDDVIVATCDEEIRTVAEAAGFPVIMTRDDHDRCTDRVEEAIGKLEVPMADDDLVVMVQGDEVMVTPAMIDAVVSAYRESGSPVVNLATRLYDPATYDDPNVVKVASAPDGRALFFSRSAIPSGARVPDRAVYQQTGIIAFRTDYLRTFGRLPQTPIEQTESVDMMRVVENGHRIHLVKMETETVGVDTPDELRQVEERLRDDPVATQYLNSAQ